MLDANEDDSLIFENFYAGFMQPYFGCPKCPETKAAMSAINVVKDDKISWQEFEFLALDYAQSRYPEFDWHKKPGRGHNQNNHDIEAIVSGIQFHKAGFSAEEVEINDSIYNIWGEVKHSDKRSKRVGKQQLDPTIVSALIAGYVVFLLFITNTQFSSNYKFRAEKALLGSTKFFDYVDETELTIWLSRNPKFAQKYFGKKTGRIQNFSTKQNISARSSVKKKNTFYI